ncbi:MAG: hypothetical protein ACI4OI_00535 [Gemmiger sp.]
MTQETNTRSTQLEALCAAVRKYSTVRDFQKCVALISQAMAEFPSAPQPHNLFGIVLEREGDHALAMRHFRAAYALDPAYAPARQNLEVYGTFCSCGRCAFDESDCPPPAPCTAPPNGVKTTRTERRETL